MRRYWGLGLGCLLLCVYSGVARAQSLNLTQTYPDADGNFFGFTYTYNATSNVGVFTIATSHVSETASTFDLTAYLQIVGGQVQAIPQAQLPNGDVDKLLVKGTPTAGSPTDYIDSTNLGEFGFGPSDTNAGADFEFAFTQDSSGTAFPAGWSIGAIIFADGLHYTSGSQPASSAAPDFTRGFSASDSLGDTANVFPEPSSGVLMLSCIFGIARRRRRPVN
jgi:hypothetical protein